MATSTTAAPDREFVGAALTGLLQDPEAFTRIALLWHRAVFAAVDHDGDRRVTVNAVDLMLIALGAEPEQARSVAAEHRTDPTAMISKGLPTSMPRVPASARPNCTSWCGS
ncbi:hypothetical protein [Streptomyces sp. NPDC051704]|uniref:hypothetical protein n=1 Tax=Streptomyces sp. NPDC051704 TaxID=3365671 RepID=UPI0037888381